VSDDPAELSLVDLMPLLESRALSARELAEACLRRMDAAEPQVRAFVMVTADLALAAADQADSSRARGLPVGPLAGVPVAMKDLYLTRGTPTTACSRVLAGHDPGVDSAVWARLRAAGAGLLGKTTTHEFAYGTASHPTRNPWDLTRTAGGSSGGSAAALAARMTPIATGSDTGGSLRIPAAACGVSVLRPTHGRVSAYGVLPLAPSLDAVGPMARRMRDVALLLWLLAGHDHRDPYSLAAAPPDYLRPNHRPFASGDLTGVRIGLPINPLWVDVDAQLAQVCRTGLGVLTDCGAELVEVPPPPASGQLLDPPWNCYDTVCAAEARHVHRQLLADPDLYTPQVLARLRLGERITAVNYLEAQRLRRVWAGQWRELFAAHRLTAVAHPAIDAPPPLVDPDQPPIGPVIRLSIPWSLAGFPALSVPVGLDTRGLPVGLSLAGLPEREADLVGLGIILDEEIAFWRRTPPARYEP
jgi:aspartyl-tRNA(Asn)/glutamyl-tRNA(Gln) amidotransferase subunit A